MDIALKALQTAINQFLRLDPDTIASLATIKHKVVAMEIKDWRVRLLILPQDDGIQLSTDPQLVADATIKGNLFDLMHVARSGVDSKSLFKHKIEIHGDVDTGEKVRDLFRDMDIDWEEHLSKIFGDSIAHQFMRGVRKLISIGQETADTLKNSFTDYMQVEAKHLPSQQQVEQFYQAVGKIRNDVDRLEARVNRLTQKDQKKT